MRPPKFDTHNMRGHVEAFPEYCREASEMGKNFAPPRGEFASVVLTGVGGSSIGAGLVRSYLADEGSIPIIINQDYTIPKFVNKETLFFACSYSGNTEETLSAYKEALPKGPFIIALTSGGKLKMRARKEGHPCISLPPGIPPRAALPYFFFPVLNALSRLGLIKGRRPDVEETVSLLMHMRDRLPDEAERIALRLKGRFVVIYGGARHLESVIARWRGQIAENSKQLASSHLLPEMNHNELTGWRHPRKIIKDFHVIFLRDKGDHPGVSKRVDITKGILNGLGIETTEVRSEGEGLMARLFSLIYIGDFVSLYLARLNREDPTPVPMSDYIKRELAKK